MRLSAWKDACFDRIAGSVLAAELGLPVPLACVLAARGVTDRESCDRFLNPRLSDISDPMLMDGMGKAVERIWQAVREKQKTVVFGDYDADGLTATAIVVRLMRKLGADADPFIPNRLDDGYGLNHDCLERCLAEKNPRLVVTVDCGTNSADEVERGSSRGVDFVVTDHHEPGPRLAPAVALVNPKLGGRGKCGELAGVGVAFKLCHALLKHGISMGWLRAGEIDLRERLDMVALGTVADIVPLTGENRIFVHHGLRRLAETGSKGLASLMETAGISGPLDSYHLGFVLGPRLNAAGRLGRAEDALELLLTEDGAESHRKAECLERANAERKRIEDRIFNEAVGQIEGRKGANMCGVVAHGSDWHVGTVGIVASRLCGLYGVPAAVIGCSGGAEARGSCRSVEPVDIVKVLEGCADLIGPYGGYRMAGGFEMDMGKADVFRERFEKLCSDALGGRPPERIAEISGWLESGELDIEFCRYIEKLRPFGCGNPAPNWAMRNVRLLSCRDVGGGRHLQMSLVAEGREFRGIAFGMGGQEMPDGNIDIMFQAQVNRYNNRESVDLNIREFRSSAV